MEKVGIDLIKNLDSQLYENHIICLDELGVFGRALKAEGYKVISFDRGGGMSISLLSNLIKYFRQNKIKVVHTNNSGPHFWAGLAAVLSGIKARIHTNHGRNAGWKSRRAWLDRFSSMLSSKIVCVSNESAKTLMTTDRIPAKKMVVITNGIDTEHFQPEGPTAQLRQLLGVDSSSIFIGSIARFSLDKDQETLIRAFNEIVQSHDGEYALLLVGDGETKQPLQALSDSLGISDKVHFMGFRSDIVEILRELDIYVLPSHTEGLSISLLEAMSTACPVVASAVGGNVGLIEHAKNGLLVPESDVMAMKNALLSLDDSVTKTNLSTQARYTVISQYSIQTMAANYQKLYEATLA